MYEETCEFYVNGICGGFQKQDSIVTLATETGMLEYYNIYRSTNPGLGKTSFDVVIKYREAIVKDEQIDEL
jgi:hypothetical protein